MQRIAFMERVASSRHCPVRCQGPRCPRIPLWL